MKNIINFFKSSNLTAPAIILSIAIVLVGLMLERGVVNFANKTDSITVTGSTERIVKSDTAKWNISVNARVDGDNANRLAIEAVNRNIASIVKFLTKSGIDNKNITVSAVNTGQICMIGSQGYENCSVGIAGYNAYANIIVEIDDVDKADSLSKSITNDTSVSGIAGNNVEYYYNALKDIRVSMLSDATKNAKERAEAVSNAGGAKIGNITSISSGVFQVTSKNSVNYDDYGAYDTGSIEKKITATVKAQFSVK